MKKDKYWVEEFGLIISGRFHVMSRNYVPICKCWTRRSANRICKLLNNTYPLKRMCPACEGTGNCAVHGLEPSPCSYCNSTGIKD